jgi:outer membrane usher protein
MKKLSPIAASEWIVLALWLLILSTPGMGQKAQTDSTPRQSYEGDRCKNSGVEMACSSDDKPSSSATAEQRLRPLTVSPSPELPDAPQAQPNLISAAAQHNSAQTESAGFGSGQRGSATGDPMPPLGESVFAVQVNGNLLEDFAHLYRDPQGRWYAPADLLEEARLLKPTGQPIRVGEEEYYPLDVYSGVTYRFDAAQQLLDITVPASNFQTQIIQVFKRIPALATASDPGFFLNNDLQVSGANTQVLVSGEEEIGFFSKLGVLTSQFAARDLTHHWAATRLQTLFFRDFPKRMTTLGVGDNYSASFSNWAEAVNYAGIRWARNFTTQPAFMPFALPSIAGSAAQPSMVSLYVNNLRMLQLPVDEGPFTISDIPALSAEGNIQMVVTDLLGRKQVVSMPYISMQQLMRVGVSQYTFESGVQRRNYGQESNGYSGWFAAGTYRHGFTNTFTLGLRGEALLASQTGGIGFDKGFLHLGVISGGIAASHDKDGQSAGLTYAQLQHSGRSFGISLYAQAAQENFRQLGLWSTQKPTRFLGQAQVSQALGRWVTVAAGYMHQDKPSNAFYNAQGKRVQRFNTITPTLSIRLPLGATLTISGNYTPEFHQRASAIATLIIPLKKQRMAIVSTGYQAGGTTPLVDYEQGLPAGTGLGYRLQSSSSNNLENPLENAQVSYQNDHGTYQLEVSRLRGQPTNWMLNYMGSAVLLHGDLLLSRQVTDGFAVVDTNGVRGLKVMANNSYVATTDRRGLAMVPSLPAYNRNIISLDESSLPLNVDVDLSDKIVVPMALSGLLVKFNSQQVQGAVLALVTEDGKELPLGAEVTVNEDKEVYEVALHGEAFIPEIQFPAAVRVHWDGLTCQATVAPPKSNEPLPQIGPIHCRRVQ